MKSIPYKTKHPLYITWRKMNDRCHNEKSTAYYWYGGKGIRVCDEWRDDFFSFANYMGERPKNMTLDRIDNAGNYEPGNVKWSTHIEQQNNTSFNRKIRINNTIMNISEWCRHYDINLTTVYQRLKYGWSEVDAITTPLNKKPPKGGNL